MSSAHNSEDVSSTLSSSKEDVDDFALPNIA